MPNVLVRLISRPAPTPSAPRRSPSRSHAAAPPLLLALTVALTACGKSSSGPDDTTPPAAPRLDRLTVGVPEDGLATVTGADSCVEPRVDVSVENLTASEREGSAVTAHTRSSTTGGFVVEVPAILGDRVSVFATDEADNQGPSVELAAGPNPSTFRLSLASGSGQTGVVNRPLTEPLRVRVRGGVPLADLPGVEVRFEVVSGGGTPDPETATSADSGIAETSLILGAAAGGTEVRATVEGVDGEIRFSATAVGAPQIVTVTPAEAERGTEVEIQGHNFSPIGAHDVVEFNGVEAEVLTAAPDRITTAVPTFASDGPVTVTLTGVTSNGVPFKVEGPPPMLPAVGSVSRIPLGPGAGNVAADVKLGFLTGGEAYAVAVEVVQSLPGFFRHTIAADVAELGGRMGTAPSRKNRTGSIGRLAAAQGQLRAERALRGWEAQVARAARAGGRPPGGRLAGAVPRIGDTETFHVINTADPGASITDPGNFDSVLSTLRFIGTHTLVYVDNRVSGVDLTDADIREVGERFDTQSYIVDRDAFGDESDIDHDGRVTVLLTATVNALNAGAGPLDGIIIGFFFSLDVLPDFSPNTSNGREMFYGFVPDPSGRFGPPIPRDFAIPTLDEVFAHEFQHMISFNEHVLAGKQPEETWLNEGLSHLAENLNGFDDGNIGRTSLYLADPAASSLVFDSDHDTLEGRGAAFLFLRWLGDQLGEGIYRRLEQSGLIGIGNVETATAQTLGALFSDWFAALYLDDSPIGAARFQIPSLSLRASYEGFRSANPTLGLGPFLGVLPLRVPSGDTTAGTTAGTSGQFYEVSTDAGTNERKLQVTAPGNSQAQVTVIRIR